jgi:hypothetical protein
VGEGFELAHNIEVVAGLDVGTDTLLECLQSEIVQAGDLSCERVLRGEIGESRPPPKAEGLSE